MRFILGFPIVLSLVAFVLACLTLFAGYGKNPGFMEDYHVLMLNTSSLGHNLVPTPASGDNNPTTTSGGGGLGGFFTSLVASATAAVGAIESDLASIADDVADELADKLGIDEFYSLHVMNTCQGSFTPNATAPGAGYNVTNCTEPLKTAQANITAMLDQQLSIRPVHLSLADLDFSQDLQHDLDKVAKLLLALAILYILGVGFSGLALLLSVLGLFTYPRHPRSTAITNLLVAGLAAVVLLAGNLTTTIVGVEVVDEINVHGDHIGLSASMGRGFLGIAWAAFGLMAVASIFWAWEFIMGVRQKWKTGAYPARGHFFNKSARDSASMEDANASRFRRH